MAAAGATISHLHPDCDSRVRVQRRERHRIVVHRSPVLARVDGPCLIEYTFAVLTADVIFPGTPPGVGACRDPRVALQPGVLRNPVAAS
jgi:hypothetical protein